MRRMKTFLHQIKSQLQWFPLQKQNGETSAEEILILNSFFTRMFLNEKLFGSLKVFLFSQENQFFLISAFLSVESEFLVDSKIIFRRETLKKRRASIGIYIC